MRRVTVNFIVNLASFLVVLVLAISGTIIALPHKHGPNELKVLGLGRGQWGDLHLWLGIAFVLLMLVHIILHWDWIVCYIKSMFGNVKKQSCEKDLSS